MGRLLRLDPLLESTTAVFGSLPDTQARGCTAACQSAVRFGFEGISFGTMHLTKPILTQEDPDHPQFLEPAGLSTVSQCFSG